MYYTTTKQKFLQGQKPPRKKNQNHQENVSSRVAVKQGPPSIKNMGNSISLAVRSPPQNKFLGGLATKVIGPWAKVTKRKGNYEPPGIYNFLHNILGASNPQGNMSKKSLKSQKKPCSH